MPDDVVYSVFLAELEGQGRLVELAASELPEQGLEAPLELRAEVTRYPAGGRTSVQINGIEEGDIELRFTFNDRLTGLDGGALSMISTLRSILLEQGMVELQWGPSGESGGGLIRRGYLRAVRPSFRLRSLIGCVLVFLPTEADETYYSASPFDTPTTADVNALLLLLDQISDAMDDAVAIANLASAWS